jgi:hypothetical protein
MIPGPTAPDFLSWVYNNVLEYVPSGPILIIIDGPGRIVIQEKVTLLETSPTPLPNERNRDERE